MRGLFYSGLFLLVAACLTSCLTVDSGEDPEVVGQEYSKLVGCWVNNDPLCEKCTKAACREICFREDSSFTYVRDNSGAVQEVYGKFTDGGSIEKFGLIDEPRSIHAVGADSAHFYETDGKFNAYVDGGYLKASSVYMYYNYNERTREETKSFSFYYDSESLKSYQRTSDSSACGTFGKFIHQETIAVNGEGK